MKALPIICLLVFIVACSQEAEITVENCSGPDLEVEIDGAGYILDDGKSVTQEIDIGKKFVFGPDDKCVPVEGEGLCKFHFSERVTVEDGDHTILTVYGDAGYIRIYNNTNDALYLYLVTCDSPSWGLPVDDIFPGNYSSWKVEVGCWCFRVQNSGSLEHCGIIVTSCSVETHIINQQRLQNEGGGSKTLSGYEPASDAARKEEVDGRRIIDQLRAGNTRDSRAIFNR
jgi:hypothetical protein